MSEVQGLYHVGITVADMDKSLRFYRDGLLLNVERDVVRDADFLRDILQLPVKSMRIVFLDVPGGGVVELLEHRGIERLPAAARPCDPGAGHACFFVDDIDAVTLRLQEMGFNSRSSKPIEVTEGAAIGVKGIYFSDPDGFLVELWQKAPTSQ